MLHTVAIRGYRSLREVILPLGRLSVITGANGAGKSSLYRALRLLADCGRGEPGRRRAPCAPVLCHSNWALRQTISATWWTWASHSPP
jgi:recombinational DNA repair ATPase RecF